MNPQPQFSKNGDDNVTTRWTKWCIIHTAPSSNTGAKSCGCDCGTITGPIEPPHFDWFLEADQVFDSSTRANLCSSRSNMFWRPQPQLTLWTKSPRPSFSAHPQARTHTTTLSFEGVSVAPQRRLHQMKPNTECWTCVASQISPLVGRNGWSRKPQVSNTKG